MAEEPWVTAAIEAVAAEFIRFADDDDDDVPPEVDTDEKVAMYLAGMLITAAQPIIEAGMREKIAREIHAKLGVTSRAIAIVRNGGGSRG